MKVFDTEILAGNPVYAERIAEVPLEEQFAPIIAVENNRSVPGRRISCRPRRKRRAI